MPWITRFDIHSHTGYAMGQGHLIRVRPNEILAFCSQCVTPLTPFPPNADGLGWESIRNEIGVKE